MVRRRAPLPAPAPMAMPDAPPPPRAVEDPLLRGLGGAGGRSAMVVEANAIRHSPVGELLLACMRNRSRRDPIERLREELGVDPLEQIDRIAMGDDALMISGHFADAKWDGLLEHFEDRRYGDGARFFTRRVEDVVAGQPREEVLAVWNDQLLIVADSEDDARKVIDRIEGRLPVDAPLIPEESTYGELYGVLAADDVARLFERHQPELAERLREVASQVELHMDTRSDVGLVADVKGSDRDQVSDLARSLGAALALARTRAIDEAEGLAEFLDLARVRPQGDQFTLELALPLPLLEKHLAFCRQPRDAEETAAGDATD